jgi:hypothetical protein
MEPIELLGIASAALLLFAFVANEWGRLSSESVWYDALNCISALGLFVYAYYLGAVPFMITNAVWGVVSGVDVVKDVLRLKRTQK